jgi:serine/threonine protein kinase
MEQTLLVIGDYKIQHVIGRGGFATCFKTIHQPSSTPVALKILQKSDLCGSDQQTDIRHEIELNKSMSHPLIAEFFDFFETNSKFSIAIEYFPSKFPKYPTELRAKKIFYQILTALEYLHNERNVCHRDIKTDNILADKSGNIRLIDFGLSRQFLPDQPTMMTTTCGSPHYIAPEVLKGKSYSNKCDIWSCGILLYFMMTGKYPFSSSNTKKLFSIILNGPPKLDASQLSPELFDLISKILVKDPNERLTIPQMKDHIWLQGFQYRNDEDDTKYKILRSGMEECKNKFIMQRCRKR